ncbi:hypothetical protein OL229_11220 [Neisseriaceae bacterium JH1-16]|nr:hypothetical protein [Neisseriaceae bacterium JH1-16]
MTEAQLLRFADWLKSQIGLDAASIGLNTIERAVCERLAACSADAFEPYWQLLQGSAHERQQLIEAVVVPETWFFRDAAAFDAAARHACKLLADGRHSGPLRLLSLPCSSGEEPYSLAMALLDAGIAPQRFQIDAVDISQRALERARHGLYQQHSFRSGTLGFRDRFFSAEPDGHRLNEAVRRQVRFRQGNLFGPELLAGEAPGGYDIVFCRNVLIYFDRATQQRAIAVLRHWLAETGLLLVGPAEAALLLRHQFHSAGLSLSSAFHKTALTAAAPVPPPVAWRPPAAVFTAPLKPAPLPQRPPRPAPVMPAPPAPRDLLGAAQCAADQGRLAEAMALCERHNREHGPNATAFYLMGLAADADGQAQTAQSYYRKTLYLDPTHQEALMQLAALLELGGDVAGAQRLYHRAQRSRNDHGG